MLNHLLTISMVFLLLIAPGIAGAAQPSLDFFIIQPGQPGSSDEARPVMKAFAEYLQRKLGGDVIIEGRYFNQTQPALKALESAPPRWGIVSLGFFLEEGERFAMQPIASTRPGGESNDRWYLAVARSGPESWRQLQGAVQGTMLFQQQSAARLMFDSAPAELSFTLEGTSSPLRAVRQTARGKSSGVILDQAQYQALKVLPLLKDLEIIHRSKSLPTSPVVCFGEPDESVRRLVEVLRGMPRDPAAKNLLQLLQTGGFGPADPTLPDLVEKSGK